MSTAIEFNNVSKQYKLGIVSTKTLSHDLNRWWQTKILRKDDPYLKIGSVNDRSAKADSDYVWALKDIDFKVEQGDVVGIIGKNGAGKSTLLKLLSRVTNPTTGTIRARGRIASLLEVGTGFHPELTGRENIYMNGSIMGMNKAEITRKLDEIVAFSGCERYIDTPVKRYSSGMTVRLGFAIAAHLDPEILVVDEVLAVGDAEFQKKAIGKMQDVSRGEGRTVLFVSHNMAAVQNLCKSGLVLENGQVRLTGSIHECVEYYLKDQIDNKNFIREGSNKVIFQDYSLTNDIINLGEHLDINMLIKPNFDVDRLMIHINIYNVDGHYITQIINDDNLFELKDLCKDNQYNIKCNIPNINLAPGKYLINLWMGDVCEWYDWIKECMNFTVIQNDRYINRITTFPSDAKVVLKSKWLHV